MTIDVNLLKENVDLMVLIGVDTALSRKSRSCYAGPCPWCGGNDRFFVEVDKGWGCRGCNPGYHDAIEYVRKRDQVGFVEACQYLDREFGDGTLAQHARAQREVEYDGKTPEEWQAAALRYIEECEQALWSGTPDAGAMLEYLHGRGLTDETIKYWRLGYQPQALGRFPGIIIPCIVGDAIWYVKTRRFQNGKPLQQKGKKYLSVKGSRTNALFGADTLVGRRIAVLTEGEFDAMLLWQEAGDLVGVATLGSAQNVLDISKWRRYLFPLRRIISAYDTDQAGMKGAAALEEIKRVQSVQVPNLRAGDKDLTDYRNAGGDLRAWLKGAVFGEFDASPPYAAPDREAGAPQAAPVEQEEDWRVDDATYQARLAEMERRRAAMVRPKPHQIAKIWQAYYDVCINNYVPSKDAAEFASIMAAVAPPTLWERVDSPGPMPEGYWYTYTLPNWEADTGVISFTWRAYVPRAEAVSV